MSRRTERVGEEVRDAKRTIPRAVPIAVPLVALYYILGAALLVGAGHVPYAAVEHLVAYGDEGGPRDAEDVGHALLEGVAELLHGLLHRGEVAGLQGADVQHHVDLVGAVADGLAGLALVPQLDRALDRGILSGIDWVVGDGEAETGPLAASWHSNKFLNPVRDGAVQSYAALTVSDSRTESTDDSGRLIRQLFDEAGHRLVDYEVVQNEPWRIQAAVRRFLDQTRPVIAVIMDWSIITLTVVAATSPRALRKASGGLCSLPLSIR